MVIQALRELPRIVTRQADGRYLYYGEWARWPSQCLENKAIGKNIMSQLAGMYMVEEDTSRGAANILLPIERTINVDAIFAVMGKGVASADGVDRARMMTDGLRHGVLSSG